MYFFLCTCRHSVVWGGESALADSLPYSNIHSSTHDRESISYIREYTLLSPRGTGASTRQVTLSEGMGGEASTRHLIIDAYPGDKVLLAAGLLTLFLSY